MEGHYVKNTGGYYKMEEKTNEQKIEELTTINQNILFYSDLTNFNSIVHTYLNNILRKLESIEMRLDNLEKVKIELETPKLPDLPNE